MLADTIQLWLSVADKRNIAVENPITLITQYNNQDFFICIAYMEPNHVTLPLNVTWIVADPASPRYAQALRRVSALPSMGYRNTWAQLMFEEDIAAEPQFWDLTSTFQLGEIELSAPALATVDVRGLFELNLLPTTPLDPVVVSNEDPRMSDARQPTPHSHPQYPATMLAGSTGINDFFVHIDGNVSPVAGQILKITSINNTTGAVYGSWATPAKSEVIYNGPVYQTLTISSSSGTSVNEQVPVVFSAVASFSDGTQQGSIPASWSIISGQSVGTINSTTGVLTTNNISGNQVVRVRAEWTHPASGVTQFNTFDLTVVDITVTAVVTGIQIQGIGNINEGSNTTSFVVVASYNDGTTKPVVPATFTSSNAGAGTLNAATGVFTSALNVTSNQLTTLSASYTEGGVTVSTTHDITVVDTTVYPQSATIVGSANVNENTTSTYTLSVTYTDGSSTTVPVTNWALDNASAGAIDAVSGVLTAPVNVNSAVAAIVSASYTNNGRTVSATKNITIVDTTIYPLSAVVQGAATVNEGLTSTYQLSVTFSDGTTSVVPVTNWTSSTPTSGVINATTGLFTANQVTSNQTTDISASFTQSGLTVGNTLHVTVVDTTNYPSTLTILGNATMGENTTQTFTASVKYQNNATNIVPITNWASSNAAAGAIDPVTGVFTANTNVLASTPTVISCSYTESGVTKSATLNLTVQDTTVYPVSATILGTAALMENATQTYQLRVTFADNSNVIKTVTNWAVDNAAAGSITSLGVFTANSVTGVPLTANITASYTLDGHTVNATLPITVADSTVYPVSATIVGPNSVNESTSQVYTLHVTFSDATSSDVAVSNWASDTPSVGTIGSSSGSFSALPTTGNATATISASYTNNGQTASATKLLTVVDTTVYPVSAIINGPSNVNENTTGQYLFHVTFTDGTSSDVTIANWATSNGAAGVINSATGLFAATTNVLSDQPTTLTGSYTANGVTVNGTKNITVKDVTKYPVSAVIVGPSSINENSSGTYSLSVTFSDASTSTIPVTNWASSNSLAGTIDSTGAFTAVSNVTGNALVTNITASYTVDGQTANGTKTISVVDTTVYPATATITGSATISEGGTSNYTFTVHYTDNSNVVKSPTNWSSTNPTAGSINATTGVFTASDTIIGNQNTVISASWTENGQTVSNTFNVTVNDTKIRPVSAVIVGASTLLETAANTSYVLSVTFDNGSTTSVPVTNWASSNASAGSIVANTGVFTPANVLADQPTNITASYTAYGITVSDTKTLTVTYVRKPVSATISGLSTMGEGSAATTYQLNVTFDDGSVVNNVATNTWTNSNASAGSIVAASGLFTPAVNVTSAQTTNIGAAYTEAGATVNGIKTINVTNTVNFLTSASVVGVSTLAGGSTTTFQFRATYEDGTNAIVPITNWSSSIGSAGSIVATTGVFTAATVASNTNTTISGSYTENGVTKSASLILSVTASAHVNVAKAYYGLGQFSDTDFTGGKTNLVNGVPTNQGGTPYQHWTGPQQFIDQQLTTHLTGAGPFPTVNMNVTWGTNGDTPQYGYFAHPAYMGSAVFTDNSTGFPGSWDGMQWADGDVGTTTGPLTVTYDDGTGASLWKVYRTDFSGIGVISFTVTIS